MNLKKIGHKWPKERKCAHRWAVVTQSQFPSHRGHGSWNALAWNVLSPRKQPCDWPNESLHFTDASWQHSSRNSCETLKGGLKSEQSKERFYSIPSTASHLHARRNKRNSWKNSIQQPAHSSGRIWPSKRQAGIESYILLCLYLYLLELYMCIVPETVYTILQTLRGSGLWKSIYSVPLLIFFIALYNQTQCSTQGWLNGNNFKGVKKCPILWIKATEYCKFILLFASILSIQWLFQPNHLRGW